MAILSAADYPTIRAALDITLDATLLPDAVISLPIYAGAAETEILERDPLALSRTGTALRHIQNAAILLAAAYLAPAVPTMTSANMGGFQYQQAAVDWKKLAAEFRGRADSELSAVSQPAAPDVANRPTMFTVASGRRGR